MAITVLLALMGVPDEASIAAGTGLVFAMIAHVSASEDWKRIRSKNLFSKETWQAAVERPDTAVSAPRLRTPVQRVWLIVMLIGATTALIAYVAFEVDGRYYNLLEALADHPHTAWGYKIPFLLGCLGAAAGFAFSFYYDQTIGRLMRWIKSGE